MTKKTLAFSTTDDDRKRIKAEQARLAGLGAAASTSAAIRSLIFRASTATDTAASGRVLNDGVHA